MANITHTPGPWAYRVAANGDCGISAEGTGFFIEAYADIRRSFENARKEAEANARLIAAAPELLASLKRLSELADQIWIKASDQEMALLRDAWKDADAAIAKAEGAQ